MNVVINELKSRFSQGNALTKFILINVVVFLSLQLVGLIFFLMNIRPALDAVIKLLAVPAYLPSLFIRPWTIFSYMFLHADFMHILFNMLVLYFSGRIFTEYMGDKKFTSTYILGGLAGGILYIISFNIFPVFAENLPRSIALGASASVLAILVAAATFVPNYTVHLILIGPVKLKFIAIFLVVLDIISIEKGNPGGHIAHIGGALYGFTFVNSLKKGQNIAGWFDRIADFFATLFRPKSKLKVSYSRRKSDEDFNLQKTHKQQKTDEILDKISKSGYESLTKEEKEFLFKVSKDL
jgi:membrane associated rhomboid family serine protease